MQWFGRLSLLGFLVLLAGATEQSTQTALARSSRERDPRPKISFEQRLSAQAAIERVYQSHRTGASRPFADAVPRPLLERKVRTYLAESVALEKLWKTPIGATALRGELERSATNTHFPDRLREIYEALGNDSILIQETFVRASLADRLARSYFARSSEGALQQAWESWQKDREREFDPAVAPQAAETLERLPQPGPVTTGPTSPAALESTAGQVTGTASPCALQDLWSAGESDVPPESRYGHTAVWTGSEMIVWGGRSADGVDLNTGARYDPLTDTWRATPLAGAPAARIDQTAVWTGSQMIVWGGNFLGGILTSGGRYDP